MLVRALRTICECTFSTYCTVRTYRYGTGTAQLQEQRSLRKLFPKSERAFNLGTTVPVLLYCVFLARMSHQKRSSSNEEETISALTDDMHLRASLNSSVIFQSMRNLATSIVEDKDSSSSSLSKAEPPPTTLPSELLRKAFRNGEMATITKVLDEIDKLQTQKRQTGFHEVNFTAGVMNVLVVSYIFGAYPQHFWIVYIVECLFFIPYKCLKMAWAKPLSGILYFLDFCWVMNFLGVFILLLFSMQLPVIGGSSKDAAAFVVTTEMRKQVFMGAFGVCCGPLLGATALLPFVAFVFHDINTMTNLSIHIMPPMLMYTLRWHASDIQEAYPTLFHLDYLDHLHFFRLEEVSSSIAGNAALAYVCWFIPYVSWMLLMGMDLPRKTVDGTKIPKYDTVFHSLWRPGPCETFGSLVWRRPVEISRKQMEMDDYERRDFLLYMTIHAVLILGSIPTLAYMCSWSPTLHFTLLILVVLICVYRGAQRYTYYTTQMYGKTVRKHFAAVMGKKL